MENKKKFIPVVLTPFNEDGSIDYDGLTVLTEFYLDAGAAGLFANCLSSEMFELTRDERLKSVEHIIKTVNGRVPVVATGTFKEGTEEQAAFIRGLYELGIEAAIIITGVMADETETDDIFNARVLELMALTPGIPVGFYECPVPYKRLLSASQLGLFADTGRVIYHKDTSLDMESIKAKLAIVRSADFGLYDAYMAHAVQSLKAGSAGLSCIQGNYFPELVVWLCDHFNNPEMKAAVDKVQEFFIDNMDVMHNVYPTVAKYFLQKRGLPISTFTRRDVGYLSDTIKTEADQLLRDYIKLAGELNIRNISPRIK